MIRPGRYRPGSLRGRSGAGVTYIELMIAVLVMGILSTLVLPTGLRMHRRAQEAELKQALLKIRTAIDAYHRDWELGYIESDHEHGWPESLEELTQEIDYYGPLPGQQQQPQAGSSPFNNQPLNTQLPGSTGGSGDPIPKVYLRRIPKDPFNKEDDEWDTGGWRARSYDDEPDSSSWGGDGLYDVYSFSDRLSLDGESNYSEW